MNEATVQDEIRAELSKRGLVTFRLQSGKFISMDGSRIVTVGVPGMSDLVAILPGGQACWLETKRSKGGKKSEDQKRFISAMQKQGCRADFCNSVEQALKICGLEEQI